MVFGLLWVFIAGFVCVDCGLAFICCFMFVRWFDFSVLFGCCLVGCGLVRVLVGFGCTVLLYCFVWLIILFLGCVSCLIVTWVALWCVVFCLISCYWLLLVDLDCYLICGWLWYLFAYFV